MSLTNEKLKDKEMITSNVLKIFRKTLRELENVIDIRYEIFDIAPIVLLSNDDLDEKSYEYKFIYNISKTYQPKKALTDYENFRYCLLSFLDSNNYMTKNNHIEFYKLYKKIMIYHCEIALLRNNFLENLNK